MLMSKNKVTDHQVGGDHYKKLTIQPTEYIMANNLNFCEGMLLSMLQDIVSKEKDYKTY